LLIFISTVVATVITDIIAIAKIKPNYGFIKKTDYSCKLMKK